ncbi:cyanase [Pseudoroseicyclus sp. H15]
MLIYLAAPRGPETIASAAVQRLGRCFRTRRGSEDHGSFIGAVFMTVCPSILPRAIRSTSKRDSTIYRLNEVVGVYGPTIKALIHEKFGDGIMSAIDFDMSVSRVENPKGDRVNRP